MYNAKLSKILHADKGKYENLRKKCPNPSVASKEKVC